MENTKVNQILDGLIDGLRSLREALNEQQPKPSSLAEHISNQLTIQSVPVQPMTVPKIESDPELPKLEPEHSPELEGLKKALWSDKWPEAVNPSLICDLTSDFDKTERARGIFELMIEKDIKKKKFLDYGCGEGHVSKIALEYSPLLSAGYDIKKQWTPAPGCLLTDSMDLLQQNKPYDIILLYDVIDHIEKEHPVDLLARVRSLLANDGQIYIRCHPFTSRHATHSYHTLNKAYVHLVFSQQELADITSDVLPNFGVVDPNIYLRWFESVGLRVLNRKNSNERIEPFFKIPKIANKINNSLLTSEFPESFGIQFIDWCLSKQ